MDTRVPYFAVTVEGQDITPWIGGITLVEDDHQADNVTLTIPDPRMIYADALMEGCRAEIDLGYRQADQHAMMLRALITKVELGYPENGVPSVKLKGEDSSIEMGLVEKKKRWHDTTVTGIVREIAGSYSFGSVQAQLTPDPRVTSEHQDAKTDLAFLQDLAKKYAAKCFVELDENNREVLYFIPERRVVAVRRPETLVLRYRQGPGSSLMSFSPQFDASYIDRLKEVNDLDDGGRQVNTPTPQPAEVVIWNLPADLRSRVTAADWDRVQTLYDAGVRAKKALQKQLAAPRRRAGEVARNQDELDARSTTLESRRLGMSASGTTIGTIWLRAKSNVVISGVHERFAGEWYVASVTHTLDSSGYKCDFKAVR
jgi:phage protein D